MTEPNAATAKAQKPKEAPLNAKEELAEFFRTALIAVLLALVIRSFMYEPFNIPSGSMKPTLEVGDYLFVSKPTYGYSRYSFPFGLAPIEGRMMDKSGGLKRGDVVVFKLPTNKRVDYIKRTIGLPGDTVQVRRGRLYINGEMVDREPVGLQTVEDDGAEKPMMQYVETLPNGIQYHIYEESDEEPLDETGLYVVPEGHYFMMGDNRDNSQDSRVSYAVGYVPYENVIGRADVIFFSTNGHAGILEVWKWPWSIRYERFFKKIKPLRPAEALRAAAE